MASPQPLENDTWRILLFGRNGAELLLFRGPTGFRLPELHIPRLQRAALNLNAEAKRLWKLETVCLFKFDVDPSGASSRDRRYHVLELTKGETLARVAPNSLVLSSLDEALFADRRDFLAVQQGMRFNGASFPQKHQGPFSEFGSFEKICAWVQDQLRRLDRHLDGCFRQFQAGSSFALVRFQTECGAVWFKAVDEPNKREFPITVELSARFPSYLPVSVARSAEWNAWLTEEASGQDLFSSVEPPAWRRAAESLAELQIASISCTQAILAAGAHDVRSSRLLALTDSFFRVAEPLMEQQTKTTPPPLHVGEIDDVREHVTSLLHWTDSIHIPDALNHLDPNPGNIFVSEEKCIFLDWAEAAVGNPFLTFEYLRQHFRRAFPGAEHSEAELCDSYRSRWNSILPDKAADEMMHIAPLTALFAHAVSNDVWSDARKLQNPGVAGYFRSLVRQMKRFSDSSRAVPTRTEATV
jgi:hypothetical protein